MNNKRIEKLLATNTNAVYTGERYKEEFISDCRRYVKACKDRRLIASIPHVSKSGMTRHIKIIELTKRKNRDGFYILHFRPMFLAFGSKFAKDGDSLIIKGCGMDMLFHTHYTTIHNIAWLGIISKKTAGGLAQQTPHYI